MKIRSIIFAMLGLVLLVSSCDINEPVIVEDTLENSGIEITAASKNLRKIVVFDSDVDLDDGVTFVKSKGASVHKKLKLINAVAISLPSTASDKARKAILGSGDVLRIDDDIVVKAPPPGKGKDKNPPSSSGEETPWGIEAVKADLIWNDNTGSGIKIGIIDTGIDRDHPDLEANIYGGINTITSKKTHEDDNGHGTHVAGTIAAIDNEIGVIGVAPDAHLYAIKALDRRGSGWLSDIIEGIDWCIDNEMQIISMSIGSNSGNSSYEAALNSAYDAGIVLIAAAGNDGVDGGVDYPARYDNVIGVSAIDKNNNLAYFSDYGYGVAVTAPGVSIKSTYKGGSYKTYNGTSMATPHAAGVAAIIIKAHFDGTSYTAEQVYTHLKNTANDIINGIDKDGAGLVDAQAGNNDTP